MAPSRSLRPSLAELFLTNLRLLDLDTLNDWPQITAKTYLSKDGQVQNQKERIACTEWALFRLFEIWDPDQTRYKLSPFFPPLEPLQSRNLRAALYRMLEDSKKNGTLGREVVLRRTMLDDCKSDKLVEILVIFSTCVVRRFIAPEILHERYHSFAIKLATSPMLTVTQQNKLTSMALAHRVTLSTLLRRKADTRDRCNTFATLLSHKSEQLSNRINACKAEESQASLLDHRLVSRVEREVFDNWPGSNSAAWPHTLLHGDETPAGDQPLKRPFQDVWDVVARGDALYPDPDAMGLVESLERRVGDQKERLKRWQEFHDTLQQRLQGANAAKQYVEQPNHLDVFDFTSHQDIKIGSVVLAEVPPSSMNPGSNTELEDIVVELKRSLHEISTTKGPGGGTAATDAQSKTTGPKFSLSDRATNQIRQPVPELRFKPLKEEMSPSWTDGQAGRGLLNVRQVSLSNMFSPAKQPFPQKQNGDSDRSKHEMQTEKEQEGNNHVDFDSLGMGVTPDITSMNGNSRMSLADRTRLSVYQAHNPTQPIEEQHEPIRKTSSESLNTGPSVADRRASLLERTQQSMSNLARAMESSTHAPLPAQRSSRPRPSSMFQLSVKKQRTSFAPRDKFFPVNQFETPGKPRSAIEDEESKRWRDRNATPTEKLFSQDADYASVFKSRPRIKQSPNPSPSVEDVSIVGIEEEDYDEEEGDWGSSPLRGKG